MPTLSEIESIVKEPGGGEISPRVLFDNTSLARQANQAAQQKAEMDWRKYNLFQQNLAGVYKQLGDLQGMEVASADRPYLQKQAAAIFKQIGSDPKKFFQGGLPEIEQAIGKLRSESTQSAQDQVFDQAHRSFLDRDPTLNTDENKAMINGFFKQPLGQRKYYTFDLPSLFKPEEIGQTASTLSQTPFFSNTLTPDQKFIQSVTGSRVDPSRFQGIIDHMYFGQDAQGRSIQSAVQKRFNSMPAYVQDAYKQKNPNDPAKAFYDDMVKSYMSPEKITKTEFKQEPFALEAMKNKDKLGQMAVKFGYDKVLEEMKLGGQKELAKYKEHLKSMSKKDQTGALNGIVDTFVNDAIAAGQAPKDIPGGLINDDVVYTLPISAGTLKDFAKKKAVVGKTVEDSPDQLLVSQDGKRVYAVFRGQGGKLQNVQKFGIDEFKLRFGKDVLGTSATEKEINASADDEEETTESSSSGTIQTTTPTKKTIQGF
jgi:hypothetical protein